MVSLILRPFLLRFGCYDKQRSVETVLSSSLVGGLFAVTISKIIWLRRQNPIVIAA